MSPKRLQTFHYHACAHAFSGTFTRPFHHQIDIQAASALPITGGHGHARVEKFQFREFISFERGYSHVSGGLQVDDKSYNTLATAVLEGLNMFDIFTADRIVSRLYSKHPEPDAEGKITWVGSKFENVRVAGCELNIELHHDLFKELLTFEHAKEAFEKNTEFRKIAEDPLDSGAKLKPSELDGAILCSIVKKIEAKDPRVEINGHQIYVPGFGRVYLGELLIKKNEKTLTMLRYELGSTTGGSGTGGGTKTNGQGWP